MRSRKAPPILRAVSLASASATACGVRVIGDPKAVRELVFATVNNLLGAQTTEFGDAYKL